jgi:DNA-directed RNA polymerase subunit RPC12/RpoP
MEERTASVGVNIHEISTFMLYQCQVLLGVQYRCSKCKTLVSEISVASDPPCVSKSCRLFKNNNTKY